MQLGNRIARRQYAQRFAENDISFAVLPDLTDQHLRVDAAAGAFGLGVAAQREAVSHYLNGGESRIIAEFTEVESGRRSDRPELERALAARVHRVPLVVAKVDRLTRSVSFLSRLLEAGVDVRFADLPSIEGPTGRFMLLRMAAVSRVRSRVHLRPDEANARGSEGAREMFRGQSWRGPH